MMRFQLRLILFIVTFFTMTALIMKTVDTQQNATPGMLNVHNARREILDVTVDTSEEMPANVTSFRKEYVKEMMRHAWNGYRKYAWGHNELRPVSRKGHTTTVFGSALLGATIVDSLDTLLIMGLDKEFAEAKQWVKDHFDFKQADYDISVFETTIRFLGGFLSAYALTGDPLFRDKAVTVGDALLPAFNSPTGLPYSSVNPAKGNSKRNKQIVLSEAGTLHMEFAYLSDVTGNKVYREKVERVRNTLYRAGKRDGFYYNHVNSVNGKWASSALSLGALGDSFYEYLLKAWLQSNQEDEQGRLMFDEAMQPLLKALVKVSNGGLTYLGYIQSSRFDARMEHLACFSGGLLALASHTLDNVYSDYYMDLGRRLTHTCRESYDRVNSKLGPEIFRFDKGLEARPTDTTKHHIMRPETVESYFILYKLTKDPIYREWGWDVVKALERHSRVDAGYSGIKDVNSFHSAKDDVQQSFFMAESLKYLYLLFSEDEPLPFDKWVFNTEAHPLPIKDVNPAFREYKNNYVEEEALEKENNASD